MTVLHSGGSRDYSDNWARAFGESANRGSQRLVQVAAPKKRARKQNRSVKKTISAKRRVAKSAGRGKR